MYGTIDYTVNHSQTLVFILPQKCTYIAAEHMARVRIKTIDNANGRNSKYNETKHSIGSIADSSPV